MASDYVQDWVIARKLEDLFNELHDIQSLVDEKFKLWRRNREDLIRCLRGIAADLHSMQKHANRSKLTGAIMGILGSAATIAGFALIPVTAGISLALSVGGVLVGAAGVVVSIVASLAEFGITKSRCDEATKMIKEDEKRTEDLKEHLEQLEFLKERLKAITTAGKLTVVLGIISIPLDICSIITESEKIKEVSKSEAPEVLESIANTLEDELLMCIRDLKN